MTVIACEFKFLSNEAAGTFEGYGAVFNNEDSAGDVLLPGAFDKTLAQAKTNGQMPKMLLNHGGMAWGKPTPEDMIPIGKWATMTPDSHGLNVKGRLINLDTESGKRIYGAMKEGELSGLSMGFKAREFTPGSRMGGPRRILKAVDLIEVSPVTFPANPLAQTLSVKSAGQPTTIREYEGMLRAQLGFSHAAARAIAEDGFAAWEPPSRGSDDGELIAMMQRLSAALRAH